MAEVTGNIFREAPILFHRQKEALDCLERGEISDIRVSHKLPVDKIVTFGLIEGFLQAGLKLFPDPRKYFEVPIEILLLPQVLQRLHDEYSLLLAPYMLNDADLITSLGYNALVLEEGFNDRAKYPRETPFHGETWHDIEAARELIESFPFEKNSIHPEIYRGLSTGEIITFPSPPGFATGCGRAASGVTPPASTPGPPPEAARPSPISGQIHTAKEKTKRSPLFKKRLDAFFMKSSIKMNNASRVPFFCG